MKITRRDDIKEYILGKGEITLNELELKFPDVSSMTLRRDLTYLESKGFILRTRGGAKLINSVPNVSEDMFAQRASENMEQKILIAKKALDYIETGRSIYIDSGTTTMCLSKVLPNTNLSIITSGPNIGLEVIKKKNTSVTIVGGQLSRNNLSISGVNSTDFIKYINIDIAFMAASGFSLKNGFTVGNYDEGELKKAVVKKAGKVILLMDSSKINKSLTFTFSILKDINVLITDVKPPQDIISACYKYGVEII